MQSENRKINNNIFYNLKETKEVRLTIQKPASDNFLKRGTVLAKKTNGNVVLFDSAVSEDIICGVLVNDIHFTSNTAEAEVYVFGDFVHGALTAKKGSTIPTGVISNANCFITIQKGVK